MSWSRSAAVGFCAGALLCLAAAYAASEAADPVYPEMRDRVAVFQRRMPRVEAVGVGNSHGGLIEFPVLGWHGMHFSAAGQDAFEAAYLARYAARAPRLRYVLFAASYGVQRTDHAVVAGSDMRGWRRQLYLRTPLQRPIDGDLDLWVAGKLAPVVRDDHWKGVIGRPIRQRPAVRLTEEGRRLPDRPSPRLDRAGLARYAASIAGQHNELGVKTMENAPGTPARVAAALDDLAGELGERDVVLVLYTPPYHGTYLRAQDPAVSAEGRAVMRRIAARHRNAVYLDYSTDPRFTWRDELFNNSDHLNPAGWRAFSRLLRECIPAALARTGAEARTPGCPAAPQPLASARPHAAAGAASTNLRTGSEEPQ